MTPDTGPSKTTTGTTPTGTVELRGLARSLTAGGLYDLLLELAEQDPQAPATLGNGDPILVRGKPVATIKVMLYLDGYGAGREDGRAIRGA
jgi:hypothetical protein